MKVCTDACLFGALVANSKLSMTDCLDIGTGTGLLSLMLAQKNSFVKIHGIEIDSDSVRQANQNFIESPWAERLFVYETDALDFNPGKKYDCIISNPPFFENDLHSPDTNKNNAKHNTSLTLVQLLETVNRLLDNKGSFAVLLPYRRLDYFVEEAAKYHLHLDRQVLVKQTAGHDFFRVILFFSRTKKQATKEEIIIKDNEGKYTTAFIEVLKDYYLYL